MPVLKSVFTLDFGMIVFLEILVGKYPKPVVQKFRSGHTLIEQSYVY